MIRFPRGILVKEKIDPGRTDLPQSLKKLQRARFTGYLHFDTLKGTGIVLFEGGRMLGASFEGEEARGAEKALASIFEQSRQGRTALSVYRISAHLAATLHPLLNAPGRKGVEIGGIDVRALLAKIKSEAFTGGVLMYAGERTAMILYRGGEPLGFFHDGAADIATTADLSRSVARLPGARIRILRALSAECLHPADLMESIDLGALWAAAGGSGRMEPRQAGPVEDEERVRHLLKETAARHLGDRGRSFAEKEFERVVGARQWFSEEALEEFCRGMRLTAKLVASPSVVSAMLEEMKKGFAALR